MRLLIALTCCPLLASAASITASASASLFFTTCVTDCQTVSAVQDVTGTSVQAAASLPTVAGGETAIASATYGYITANAYSNTGLFGPVSGHIVAGEASSEASFDDVIHFSGGSGTGMLDALILYECCVGYDGYSTASFQIGTAAHGVMADATTHLLTGFSLTGDLTLSGRVSATAKDFMPWDRYMGSSDANASVRVLSMSVGTVVAYYSDSGTHWLGDGGYTAPVRLTTLVSNPEPATWTLILIGAVIAAYRRP